MKVIFSKFDSGFFEFIELPITKDSRRVLIDKNRKNLFFVDLQHPIDLKDLLHLAAADNIVDE